MLRETAVLEDEEGFPGLSERGDEGTVEDRRELVLWCPNVGRVEATRGVGGGSSTFSIPKVALTWLGLTNIPYPGLHGKYASPLTVPSFLPFCSYNSTPIQLPGENFVDPTKRTTPRPAGISTMLPTTGPELIFACSKR